jgi:hypothetical protein
MLSGESLAIALEREHREIGSGIKTLILSRLLNPSCVSPRRSHND